MLLASFSDVGGRGAIWFFYWEVLQKFVILSLNSAVRYIYTTQLCSEKWGAILPPPTHTHTHFRRSGHASPPLPTSLSSVKENKRRQSKKWYVESGQNEEMLCNTWSRLWPTFRRDIANKIPIPAVNPRQGSFRRLIQRRTGGSSQAKQCLFRGPAAYFKVGGGQPRCLILFPIHWKGNFQEPLTFVGCPQKWVGGICPSSVVGPMPLFLEGPQTQSLPCPSDMPENSCVANMCGHWWVMTVDDLYSDQACLSITIRPQLAGTGWGRHPRRERFILYLSSRGLTRKSS